MWTSELCRHNQASVSKGSFLGSASGTSVRASWSWSDLFALATALCCSKHIGGVTDFCLTLLPYRPAACLPSVVMRTQARAVVWRWSRKSWDTAFSSLTRVMSGTRLRWRTFWATPYLAGCAGVCFAFVRYFCFLSALPVITAGFLNPRC